MTTWRVVLPAGLDNKNFERGEVVKLGGDPPIRFVPTEATKESTAPLSTFTQKVSDDAKETFARFHDGTLEDAIKHIIQFNALSKKLGYQTKAKDSKKPMTSPSKRSMQKILPLVNYPRSEKGLARKRR